MTDKRKRTRTSTPVSAHPAFPAIVALWFAGLLGLGSVVLPAILIERIAEATGLSSAFAAAQPPLGMTARTGIALAAGIFGAVVGLAIAHRIAKGGVPGPAARPAEGTNLNEAVTESAKRPIFAHDELFEGGLDAPPPSDPEESYIPDYLQTASVAADAADVDIAMNTETASEPAAEAADLLDLARFEEAAGWDPAEAWDLEPSCETGGVFEAGAIARSPAALPVEPAVLERKPEEALRPVAALSEELRTDARDAGANVAIVDLVDRFARALQRHRDTSAQQAEQAAREDESVSADAAYAAVEREFPAQLAEASTVEIDIPAPVSSGDSIAASPRLPDVLREIDFDDDSEFDEEDDDGVPALDLSLSLAQSTRPFGQPGAPAAGIEAIAVAAVEDDAEESDEGASEENYPSLLAMKSSYGVQREPVRFPDEGGEDAAEPVVAFPGNETRNPDAERALRDALEKLQRMSGAA